MAEIVKEHFDNIHFTESLFSDPVAEEQSLLIRASRVQLLANHPFFCYFPDLINCVMRFNGVICSRRRICEYICGSNGVEGMKEPSLHEDGPFSSESKKLLVSNYVFEGVLQNPYAWVGDWIVQAESFELQIGGKREGSYFGS